MKMPFTPGMGLATRQKAQNNKNNPAYTIKYSYFCFVYSLCVLRVEPGGILQGKGTSAIVLTIEPIPFG